MPHVLVSTSHLREINISLPVFQGYLHYGRVIDITQEMRGVTLALI